MLTGTVKRVVPERGFGFIEDNRGTEYFFHRTNVEDFDALRGGETATFEPEEGPKGKRANQVRIDAEPAAESNAPVAEVAAPVAESAPEAANSEPVTPAPAAESEAPAQTEEPAVEQG
jgi:cold shock CspA family protein